MRHIIAVTAVLTLFGGLALVAEEKQEKKAPSKLTFTAKTGNITYDHTAHAKREKNDCKVCHDKLWPQDAKAPLNFKAGMHKPAEAKKSSCASCHVTGGKAFETKGNCTKCHAKPAAKPAAKG